MRSCGAVALVLLAIITECLGAKHSDRSRQRSSSSRSVPRAAAIKREVDFDCPEEFGYYPHPTDCTLYYVCVFGGALLESCTGGLMYSHELQTCDWPRNVGCDGVVGATVIGGDEVDRISQRAPPPPPPQSRRTPAPPPPRTQPQPNPVVTSRGQPKFNHREQYEQQQQLYAEVDDLPPIEEIESDRQQRVYRGQPSTIGQVQKDRDGYIAQVNPGRNFNSNIIPASIPQNSGKIGSFSFGTQVDDRRAATITPAPQTYNGDSDNDSFADRLLDVETNEINVNDITIKNHTRSKREVTDVKVEINATNTTNVNQTEEISKRSDSDDEFEYYEAEPENFKTADDVVSLDDTERGKRQVGFFIRNGYKNPTKNWAIAKPVKALGLQQQSYTQNRQTNRYQSANNNGLNNYEVSRRPITYENNFYSTANPFLVYQANDQTQRFKPSLPDPYHNNQIITKSPPISSLNNNENTYLSLGGVIYNNAPKPNTNLKYSSQIISSSIRPISYPDSSLLPSTVVTGKPLPSPTSPRNHDQYRHPQDSQDGQQLRLPSPIRSTNFEQNIKDPSNNQDYDDYDEDTDEEENSSEEENEHPFPEPPYEFTHPRNKYTNIENPFANPNFDFDAYLAKVSNGQYSTTSKPKNLQSAQIKNYKPAVEVSTASNIGIHSSTTLNYIGVSTPKPFTLPGGFSTAFPIESSTRTLSGVQQYQSDVIQRPHPSQQTYLQSYQQQQQQQQPHQQQLKQQHYPQQQQQQQYQQLPQQQHYQQQQQQQHKTSITNVFNRTPQQSTSVPLSTIRPKLNPPNFKDDRQLPITYSFSKSIDTFSNNKPSQENQQNKQFVDTQKPYLLLTATGAPVLITSSKPQYVLSSENYDQSKPNSRQQLIDNKYTTPKPLTTLVNEQLTTLQQYWKNPSTANPYFVQTVTFKPTTTPNVAKLGKLFAQAIKSSTQSPLKNYNMYVNIPSTTKTPLKRRPIPKPSPEMNDYYYDDDEDQYYHKPPVKSKYMPSSEVMPKRPPMAQNYQEYEDSASYEDSEEQTVNIKPKPIITRRPPNYNTYKVDTSTKYANDVSVVTKTPLKEQYKNENGKIPVPVLYDNVSPPPSILIRPGVSNYEIVHHVPRNKTTHNVRKPIHLDNGPNTEKPPKYLNQTTLRPYTVRHRLAKPTTVQEPVGQKDEKQIRGRVRHPNLVAQIKSTTPHDSHNQETRYTKTKHDDKTNSLEPTESVTPVSYSANHRPKMLYNGSQNYNLDQYDPYYAVYDEDGELYKDTDYDVQQYNTASLRPAVQQTYRGTPPPARRPVETYTSRPSPDDYDDALIQGQINNNQNQYQSAIRHSTRGEGNELGYDHNPSSVRTTLYEATSLSTSPPTTSTSTTTTTTTTTTTQRPTTAPYTEAMTPSRYTPRSSTDEKSTPNPELSPDNGPSDVSNPSIPTTPSSDINISSIAKPLEKTDNLHRLKETLITTELPTYRHSFVTNNNKQNVEVTRATPSRGKKKVLSLTTGFSIRRNINNTNNPYTLTVLTRPFDEYNKLLKSEVTESSSNSKEQASKYYYDTNSDSIEESVEIKPRETYPSSTERPSRGNDAVPSEIEEYDIPIYVKPTSKIRSTSSKKFLTTSTTIATPSSISEYSKYRVKSTSSHPTHLTSDNTESHDFTINSLSTEAVVDRNIQNMQLEEPSNNSFAVSKELAKQQQHKRRKNFWDEPIVSPYKSLDNIRNIYSDNADTFQDYTSTKPSNVPSTTTTQFTTTSTTPTPIVITKQIPKRSKNSRPKSSYYSYRIEDEVVPDQTTEIFNGKVKNVIQAIINNFVSTPRPRLIEEISSNPIKSTTPLDKNTEDKVVNIGIQKKAIKYIDEKRNRNGVKRIQIITEPSLNEQINPSVDTISVTDNLNAVKNDLSSTISMTTMSSSTPFIFTSPPSVPVKFESTSNKLPHTSSRSTYQSRFNTFITDKPDPDSSRTFQHTINEEPNLSTQVTHSRNNDQIIPTRTSVEVKTSADTELFRPTSEIVNEIASTTSTTKATSTIKIEPTSTSTSTTTTTMTKSISFPTRASRVNPAIKLAATNPGSGRRSYQSSSKCSSDNSLQANPKCNEIKYQRPTSTRGRGSAHYSTQNGKDSQPQPIPNRGTPPTRSRPTLKPSTAIVSKSTEFVDIYAHPPNRPAPVYPQPTVDKTAAKCRKDVCLLPDCYCGGKEIPGDLPVESVPQIVLLTFDDSVNDLNKGLYADLFEKGRVNPNGCPITATFYVSHEWTDYSQVQNLYSAGHEMASHTVSHSFGEQFSQKKWNREVGGQREILAAYGGVKLEDVRGMRAPFLSIGGNKMFKMLYDSNFTYDSSMPVYENRPPSWPYTLDYKLFHDCMIPPCPTKSYPGVWEVPMVMWQDLNGGRCSMGDACANPSEAEGVYKMILKNFDRHYTTNRAPFGLFYHAAWFTQPHHKEGFIMFLDFINQMSDVWIVTNWQALQWVRDPTPISRINNFQPFQCNYQDRPKKCNNPKVCNLWHKSGVRYMRTCQPCPEIYPWTGKSGIRSSRIDNDNGE